MTNLSESLRIPAYLWHMEPLVEFIRAVLEESRPNTAKLKSLKSPVQINKYMTSSGYKQLGCGSSRCAYVISSKWALKVAQNDKGYAQNEAEVDVVTNPKSKPIFAKIQDAAPDYSWLLSELVRPLKDRNEFEKLTGVNWYDAMQMMGGFEEGIPLDADFDDDEVDAVPQTMAAMLKKYRGSVKKLKFLKALTTLMGLHKLLPGDTQNLSHWGKTADGRVVILDYGFTDQVHKQHYTGKPDKSPEPPEDAWEDIPLSDIEFTEPDPKTPSTAKGYKSRPKK